MRDQFIATFSQLAEADRDLMLLTGDLGFGVLTEFSERFPSQYLNVGVAEQNLTGVAAGLALAGKRVFTYSIANFPTLRCLEQIRNDVCYHDLPVTIVAIGGGLSYGPLGFSHQATEDLAIMRSLPNMAVIAPSDDIATEQATVALASYGKPAYLRLDRVGPSIGARPPFGIGDMNVVFDSGRDLLLLAIGAIVRPALDAARTISESGFGVTLVECPTLKPFDTEFLLKLVGDGYRLGVTVEEHSILGGLGSAVAETISSPEAPGSLPLIRLGLPDVLPTTVGSQAFLRAQFNLTAEAIADAAMSQLSMYMARRAE